MEIEVDIKLLKKLSKLENDEYELSEENRLKLASRIDLKFIAGLLVKYTARQNSGDVQIFNILQVVERRLGVSLKFAAPFVFGPESLTYYREIISYGRSLKNFMNPDGVLKCLDRELLLKSSYLTCRGPREELYDPRFILRLFISMVHRGTEMTCLNFVMSGALQYVLSSLSLRDAELRSIAYVILQRFLSLSNDLSAEHFPEKPLLNYFLRLVKYGIPKPNTRLPSPISRFLAECVNVIVHPTNPMFKSLMASLIQRPALNLETLTEFRKFFYSTSLANFRAERRWILNICAMSVHEPGDYGLLEKSSIIGSCLSIYANAISSLEVRKRVLGLLSACLRHESCARDLFLSHNLSTWLAIMARHPVTTAEDLSRIQQLHERLCEHLNAWLERVPNPLIKFTLRMNAKRIAAISIEKPQPE